jgi:hypothetical protein
MATCIAVVFYLFLGGFTFNAISGKSFPITQEDLNAILPLENHFPAVVEIYFLP